MGNESTKAKTSKEKNKPVVHVTRSRGKTLDNTKSVLLLYKISWENASNIVRFLCMALNQAKPAGCVAIENVNVVDLSANDMQDIKNRTLQWLANPNCVVLLCLSGDGLSREEFVDENEKLSCKIFPVCFGSNIPTDWPEAYCLGVNDPETLERPNELEGDGLDTLVAAIRGAELSSGLY